MSIFGGGLSLRLISGQPTSSGSRNLFLLSYAVIKRAGASVKRPLSLLEVFYLSQGISAAEAYSQFDFHPSSLPS